MGAWEHTERCRETEWTISVRRISFIISYKLDCYSSIWNSSLGYIVKDIKPVTKRIQENWTKVLKTEDAMLSNFDWIK